MMRLLAMYADRLARLRDRSGRRRRISRPIRQGRELDRYLLGDGLDASTIVSDLKSFTEDGRGFERDVSEYAEYLDGYPEQVRARRQPRKLVPSLREGLGRQAERLEQDTAVTTGNIRASAELRQAMANTKLQRWVVGLSFIAVVAAVISLIVALHGTRH